MGSIDTYKYHVQHSFRRENQEKLAG